MSFAVLAVLSIQQDITPGACLAVHSCLPPLLLGPTMARELNQENVRRAALHALKLAASYEAAGATSDLESDGKLQKLIDAVLPSETATLGQSRRGLIVEIAHQLGQLYRSYQSSEESEHDLQKKVESLLRSFGLEPVDDIVDVLLLTRDEIRVLRGPVEAAVEATADAFDIAGRTIFNWRQQPQPLLAPVAYGRSMGQSGLIRYALTLLGVPESETRKLLSGLVRTEQDEDDVDEQNDA